MKIEVHPNNIFSKRTWPYFLMILFQKNIQFVLDIQCKLKNESFIPMNEQWAESSLCFNNSRSRIQCCSNEFVQNNILFNFYTCWFSIWFADLLWWFFEDYFTYFTDQSSQIFPIDGKYASYVLFPKL